jgi:hypothetical protein
LINLVKKNYFIILIERLLEIELIMFDSDDFAYPKTLEVYNHMFLKHPEVMGMCCEAHTVEHDGRLG